MWRRQNPLDTEITRENCAALGIPGYFDVVERSMSLQVINVGPGGRREGGREGGIQVINGGMGAEREGGREGGYGQAWSVVGGPRHSLLTRSCPSPQRKIRDSEYRALRDFVDDVELMVQNAKTFNAPAHPVHAFAEETRLLFARLLEGHKKDYALREE